MMTLGMAHQLLPGATLVGDPSLVLKRVHSDTRTLRPGDFFVALRGERFDAHDFLPQARDSGCTAALAKQGLAEAGLSGLQVPDTLAALQQLAQAWRAGLMMPLIAVTGSNGKTTVTQMVASILRAWLGDAALATAGNFNNHIGVPLTLLRLSAQVRAAVIELGMNHPGEIHELATMAAPTVAVITNAQREHLEFMRDVEAVARENGQVLNALTAVGTVVIPADDTFTPLWRELAGPRKCLSFGPGGDVQADAVWSGTHWAGTLRTPQGPATLTLHVAGAHNLRNASAAAAAALAAGAPLAAVAAGLAAFVPVKGRSAMLELRWRGADVFVVDDSYNANPDSVLAAIDVLAALPAPRWLVLGDMGEVGDQGPAFHAEVGAQARDRGLESLWCAGPLSRHAALAFGPEARHFERVEDLLLAWPQAPRALSVLVKGSRFMKMERVIQALQQEASHAA